MLTTPTALQPAPPSSKHRWNRDLPAKAPAAEAAAETLRRRLAAVLWYLPLAAVRPECDLEHVHQLRVAVRRAMAALNCYRPFFPKAARQSLKQQLRNLRQAAGAARDTDVLIDRLSAEALEHNSPQLEELLQVLRQDRVEAQLPLVRVWEEATADDRLERTIAELLADVKPRGAVKHKRGGRGPALGQWARSQLQAELAEFSVKADELAASMGGPAPSSREQHADDESHETAADLQDEAGPHAEAGLQNEAAQPAETHAALHQFRIAGKRLRYGMELFGGMFPGPFRKRDYPDLVALQDLLGAINDQAVAAQRFRALAERLRGEGCNLADYAEERAERSQQEHERLEAEFSAWWTAKRRRRFERRFTSLLTR